MAFQKRIQESFGGYPKDGNGGVREGRASGMPPPLNSRGFIRWERLGAGKSHLGEETTRASCWGISSLRHERSDAKEAVGHVSLQLVGGEGESGPEPERTSETAGRNRMTSAIPGGSSMTQPQSFPLGDRFVPEEKNRMGFEGKESEQILCNKIPEFP